MNIYEKEAAIGLPAILAASVGAQALQSIPHIPDSGGKSPRIRAIERAIKSAKDEGEKKKLKKALVGARVASESIMGAPAAAGGILGGLALSGKLRKGLVKNVNPKEPLENIRALVNAKNHALDMMQRMGVDKDTRIILSPGATNAAAVPKGGTLPWPLRKVDEWLLGRGIGKKEAKRLIEKGGIILPLGNPEIAAHEVGHLSLRKTPLSQAAWKVGRSVLPIAGIAAATAMAAGEDPESLAVKAAPLVGAAGLAPILADEGLASLRGLKALKKSGVPPAQLAAMRKNLLKALGTYGAFLGLGIGLPLAVTAWGRPAVSRYMKKKQKEQS